VNDYTPYPEQPTLNRPLAHMLMEDLRDRRPRFIVDAADRSWTLAASGDPWLYRLDRYPRFELLSYLESDYRLAGRFDDCDVYVRR
jgi:hypothetical protein